MALRVQLLGGFSVRTNDGKPVAFATRKAEALFAVLAAKPGLAHSRDRLAAMFWPNSAETQARGSLRQTLALIRKATAACGHSCLDAGETVRLNPAEIEVDVAAFDEAVESDSAEQFERAAALYGGEFLADVPPNEEPFEEWRRTEVARLRQRAIDGLRRLLVHYVEAGAVDEGLRVGEQLLALDPMAEEAHRAIMRLNLCRGARSAALRQYERCRATLEAELGVTPAPETEGLRREILARPSRASASERSGLPSIAVLPFTNLSDDPQQSYIADGIAADVIRELSRFRCLNVIARHSSFAFRDLGMQPQEIGDRLGARYLLFGDVRRAGESVRIGTELVEVGTGYHLWADRYDVRLENVFEVQDEIARNVVGQLASRIDAQTLQHARRKPTNALEAYDCWLRGLDCLRRAVPQGLEEARALFRRALEIDPHYARAYSGLSLTHFNEWSCNAWHRWAENERKAFDYAHQAVTLDDTDHVTHFILGRILLYRREFERAEQHLDRAEALNPNDADTLIHLALAQAYLGNPERGIALAETALRLNPFHDSWYFAFAGAPYFAARRYAEAIPLGLKAPDAAVDVRAYLAAAYAHIGELEKAREQIGMFLQRFRERITFGREPGPDEPVRWTLHVNPFRHASDADYLIEGLKRAGLTVKSQMTPA